MGNEIAAALIGGFFGFVLGAIVFTAPGREVAEAAARRARYYVEPPRRTRRR